MADNKDKKRILLLGDARQVHLSRWGAYLLQNGYDVLTISLEPARDIAGRSELIRIPRAVPAFLRYPMAVPSIRRKMRDYQPHLVNAHFLPNYGVMAALSGFTPWVLSTWGSDIMMLPDKSAFHMERTRRVIRSAAYITSDAMVMSERLAELGADPQRIVTVPFGVDRSLFYPTGDPLRDGGPRIVSNRKLETVYNIETILGAFPAVKKRLTEATLTVAGTGSLASTLRADAARTAPPSSVRFVGDIEHGDMASLLRDHDIYLSMSLSDTTSVSLLEAMACGLFPIVSDIPANREWIKHDENGLLVTVRDSDGLARAVVRAWRDAALRATAAERNAAVIAARADWSENMSVVGSLFARILGSAV